MCRRVVAYKRVSTDEQARFGVSLDMQETKFRQYCELNDLELVEVYEDDVSASTMKRPGLQKALEAVYRKDIDGILIFKLDRMFRDATDALNTAKQLDAKNKALMSINENIDTKSASGKFFFTMLAALAEMERNQIAERTRDALQHKKSKGERVGSIAFGYEVGDDGKTLVENEAEQAVIRTVCKMRSKGVSMRKIVANMDLQGIVNPRTGKPLQYTQVNRILNNN